MNACVSPHRSARGSRSRTLASRGSSFKETVYIRVIVRSVNRDRRVTSVSNIRADVHVFLEFLRKVETGASDIHTYLRRAERIFVVFESRSRLDENSRREPREELSRIANRRAVAEL